MPRHVPNPIQERNRRRISASLATECHCLLLAVRSVSARYQSCSARPSSPGELVLAGNEVLIERLMHVPQEAQVDLRHLDVGGPSPQIYLSSKKAAHGRRRQVAADRTPEYVVQFVVVVLVSLFEFHMGGAARGGGIGRVFLKERNARLFGGVRGRVGLALEGGGHGPRAGIEVRHGLQSQKELHGAEHGGCIIHAAVDGVVPGPGGNEEGGGTMGIHVVGTVLGVVLKDENGGIGPKARFGDAFDQLAAGVVVIGSGGERGDFAGGGAGSVVVGEAHYN